VKVFLSHASEDAPVATQICMALRGAGHGVFFDADDLPPGGDYNARIRAAIEASDAFVFLLSPHAVDAGSYTLSELRFARQRWPRPWGHVLPVMIAPTPWSAVDPWLGSITVLRPAGNVAAETVDALARLPESAEAKAESARWASPLFALLALALGLLAIAWGLTALAFGFGSDTLSDTHLVLLAVLGSIALPLAIGAAVLRRRDATVHSLGAAWLAVGSRPWFGVLACTAALAGCALVGWRVATTGQVTVVAPQDVELHLVDGPGPGSALGLLEAGVPRTLELPVGRHRLLYREAGQPDGELAAVDGVEVARAWPRRAPVVIALPPLGRYGTLREIKE